MGPPDDLRERPRRVMGLRSAAHAAAREVINMFGFNFSSTRVRSRKSTSGKNT